MLEYWSKEKPDLTFAANLENLEALDRKQKSGEAKP